jgi:hypothetical protein
MIVAKKELGPGRCGAFVAKRGRKGKHDRSMIQIGEMIGHKQDRSRQIFQSFNPPYLKGNKMAKQGTMQQGIPDRPQTSEKTGIGPEPEMIMPGMFFTFGYDLAQVRNPGLWARSVNLQYQAGIPVPES